MPITEQHFGWVKENPNLEHVYPIYLCNDIASNSNQRQLICKCGVNVAKYEVLSKYLHDMTEDNHLKHQ